MLVFDGDKIEGTSLIKDVLHDNTLIMIKEHEAAVDVSEYEVNKATIANIQYVTNRNIARSTQTIHVDYNTKKGKV